MNSQTDFEQDEQALTWFDIQDEMQAEEQGRMDYEQLESERLWEEYMQRARTQSTSSDEEEDALEVLRQVASDQQPLPLSGRKRRYSEIEQSDSEEEDFSDSEEDSEEEEDGIGNCGFRCDGRCRWCESGRYDPRDEI